MKSSVCFLTHRLQMASILFATVKICCNQFKWEQFFLKFCSISEIYIYILKKLMTLIGFAYPKLQTAKWLVRPMSKKRYFKTPFDSHNFKNSQTFVKSTLQHFYHIFSSLLGNLSWKMSLLVICEILWLFVTTLTVDDKYFLCYSENVP